MLFLSNDSIEIKNSIIIKGLVVIGGGGDGSNNNSDSPAGGGAQVYYNDKLNLNLNPGTYQIVVGSGGMGGIIGAVGTNGNNSSAFNITALGGNGGTNGTGNDKSGYGVGGASIDSNNNDIIFKNLGRGGFAKVNYILTESEQIEFQNSPKYRYIDATNGLKIKNQKLINMIIQSLSITNTYSYIYLPNSGNAVNYYYDTNDYSGKSVKDLRGESYRGTDNSPTGASGQHAIVYGSGGGASSRSGNSSRNIGQTGGNGMHGLVYFFF